MQGIEQPQSLEFSGNIAEKWERFQQRFLIYLSAIGCRRDKDED